MKQRFFYLSVLFVFSVGSLACGGGDDGPIKPCEGDACGSIQPDLPESDTTALDGTVIADEGNSVACNPVTGSGCDDGFHCIFNDASKTECLADGPVAVGAECEQTSDCEEGICVNLEESGQLCYPFCNGPINCPTEMPECVGLLEVDYQICVPEGEPAVPCNLVTQDCEEAGHGCFIVGSDPNPGCYPAGDATLGEVCTSANSCAPGFVCINATCLSVCDVTAEEPCEDDANCANYYGPQNAGYCGFSG